MRVNPFRSIAAKLFYLTTGVVLLTVAINSWQNAKTFKQFLTNQFQDSTILRARAAAQNVNSTFDNWGGQINLIMHDLQGSDSKNWGPSSRAFVSSNKDYLAFHVFRQTKDGHFQTLVSAYTDSPDTARFEGKIVKDAINKLAPLPQKWLEAYTQSGGPAKPIVESFADQTGLPVMALAMNYSRGPQENLWAVLTTWQTTISAALPKSSILRSYIIDSNGVVFSAPTLEDIVARDSLKSNKLARNALVGNTLYGFKGGYKDKKGAEWLGAFMRIPKFNMAVLVEHKAEVAYAAIKRIIRKTALWGLLLVLVAVMLSFVGTNGLTRNLRDVIEATKRMSSGDFDTRVVPRSKDEIALLSFSVNQMAQKIVDLLKVQVEQARVEKELETARMVQSTFFPKENIKHGKVSITGFYEPATECGGDWWGHFTSNDKDGVEYVFIADAMGHGVPAALVTAMAYSSCMTLSNIIQDTQIGDSPAKILERFNKVLYEAVRGTISMTFFAAIFDTKNGKLTFANAGHNFPVLVPLDANDDRAGKKKLKSQAKISDKPAISLKLQGAPLGMEPNAKYEEKSMVLRGGDKVFMFTDGLVECTSPDGKAWGRKTLIETILQSAETSAETMKDTVVKSAFDFFSNKPIVDDVTIVVVEVDKMIGQGGGKLPQPGPQFVQAPPRPLKIGA